MRSKPNQAGIRARHARSCPAGEGKCRCKPSYEAFTYSARDDKKIRKTFPTISAAKAWRAEASTQVRKGELRTPSRVTLHEAATAWLDGAKAGTVRARSGDVYKPSVLRGYEQALQSRILPLLGGARLGDVRRLDVQDLADRLLADGLDASTVRNQLMPLRAIYRRALVRGDVAVNPTLGLELPAVRGKRERVAWVEEMAGLLGVLPVTDRALWATAFYAGLRLGELCGLRFEDDLDLSAEPPLIRVERSWDQVAGAVEPKSQAGRRSVPVPDGLRRLLREHRLAVGRSHGLVFGRDAGRPFNPSSAYRRAFAAWEAAGLEPIRLHECRHSFVTLWTDAGVSLERGADYAGHASTGITNRYRHLRDGRRADDLALVNAYLTTSGVDAREARQAAPLGEQGLDSADPRRSPSNECSG